MSLLTVAIVLFIPILAFFYTSLEFSYLTHEAKDLPFLVKKLLF
jgi:hypothetical protein